MTSARNCFPHAQILTVTVHILSKIHDGSVSGIIFFHKNMMLHRVLGLDYFFGTTKAV
jgi:hypothetical protein